MTERLKTAVQIKALIRQTQVLAGFATVIARGDSDRGEIIVISAKNGVNQGVWERILSPDGTYKWANTKHQDIENKQEFDHSLRRRREFDPDLWIIELDIPDETQLIAVLDLIA